MSKPVSSITKVFWLVVPTGRPLNFTRLATVGETESKSDFGMAHSRVALLAPPEGKGWSILWSSQDPRYGGGGTPPLDTDKNWHVPAEATVVMAPE